MGRREGGREGGKEEGRVGVIMWREVGREGGREGCEREGIKEDGESNRILCTVYLIKLNTGMYVPYRFV